MARSPPPLHGLRVVELAGLAPGTITLLPETRVADNDLSPIRWPSPR